MYVHLCSLQDAPDYYSYIKNPMWLKKIEENLEGGLYQTEVDVFEDLQRIVDNSKEYNTRPDSKVWGFSKCCTAQYYYPSING